MIRFFSKEEEYRLIEAIREAEQHTSGEVRVHLEQDSKGDVLEEAWQVFFRLGMHQTRTRAGVLIFLAPERREFAIIGDEGITQLATPHFWEEERDLMQSFFRKGEFVEGLCQAVVKVGEKLKAFFPREEDDENELSDDISYGVQPPK